MSKPRPPNRLTPTLKRESAALMRVSQHEKFGFVLLLVDEDGTVLTASSLGPEGLRQVLADRVASPITVAEEIHFKKPGEA